MAATSARYTARPGATHGPRSRLRGSLTSDEDGEGERPGEPEVQRRPG